MNNKRREKIKNIINILNSPNVNFISIQNKIEKILDEEQDSFESLPENLQYSKNGEKSEEAIGYLEDALESIEEYLFLPIEDKENKDIIEETINNIIDYLKDAIL